MTKNKCIRISLCFILKQNFKIYNNKYLLFLFLFYFVRSVCLWHNGICHFPLPSSLSSSFSSLSHSHPPSEEWEGIDFPFLSFTKISTTITISLNNSALVLIPSQFFRHRHTMTILESVIHTLPKDIECRDRKVVEK